jgi:leucyl-tRNA synthetase
MQQNWIGKSFGVRFAFPYELDGEKALLRVFTTRADTIMGVTFCAVAAEHPLATRPRRASRAAAVHRGMQARRRRRSRHGDDGEEGHATGLSVTHPLTGEQVEVWVGNYVLMSYGDGAVMGVPGTTSATSRSRRSTACRSSR